MYLEIDEGFDSHPKTVRLCRVMRDVNAGQYLIRIWAWACRSAPDGDISGMEAQDVEAIAKYAKADGKLFAALTETWSPKFGPWIDTEESSMKLHGWKERQGAAIERMSKNAARMRDARERRRAANVQRTCSERADDEQSTCSVRPDQTRPDQTSKDLHTSPVGLKLFGDESEKDVASDNIRKVFAHYRKHHPKAFRDPQPGTKEWRLIRDRLKEGSTVEELCLCIDGYHKSPHHLGKNERNTVYLDLELFMRDGSHVTRGIELADSGRNPQPARQSMDLVMR